MEDGIKRGRKKKFKGNTKQNFPMEPKFWARGEIVLREKFGKGLLIPFKVKRISIKGQKPGCVRGIGGL